MEYAAAGGTSEHDAEPVTGPAALRGNKATTIDGDRARARYFARLLIALSTNGKQAED